MDTKKTKKLPRKAVLKCRGGKRAPRKFDYPMGLKDCREAIKLYGSNLECGIGCIGLGSCANACRFDAIEISEETGLPIIDEERCNGCGKCVVICPQHALELVSPISPLLRFNREDDCLSPCQQACPAGVDIPRFIRFIKERDYERALFTIKEHMPIPLAVGRVCPRPCEDYCTRNEIDEPVAINFLKRFVADYQLNSGRHISLFVAPSTGHRVAIVGGGPAGLSCAYFLRRLGHDVTIFEAMPKLGGMLRYGIPDYRLPQEILDLEIKGVIDLGIDFRSNTALGKDFSLKDLRDQSYEAIFLGTGAWKNRGINIEGRDLIGVWPGLVFLRRIAEGERVNLGPRVMVIGGGNVAMDVARSAIRLGAEEVYIIYRRSYAEMPALREEVKAAEEEGIKFLFLANPIRLIGKDNRLRAVEYIKMKLGRPDVSGRPSPEPIPGTEKEIEIDTFIEAIGQYPDISFLKNDPIGKELEFTKRCTIVVNKDTYQTNIPFIFSAGDVVLGPRRVVDAIGTARLAAYSIHSYLKKGIVKPPEKLLKGPLPRPKIDKRYVRCMPRAMMPERGVKERIKDFKEVELGFTEEMAQYEARRCLNCGLVCYDKVT